MLKDLKSGLTLKSFIVWRSGSYGYIGALYHAFGFESIQLTIDANFKIVLKPFFLLKKKQQFL
jgi:hypothetical protein